VSWSHIGFSVRPADPMDRRGHEDAHEVIMTNHGKSLRCVGVWTTERAATEVATHLTLLAKEQIR
jgi:hypothetical protein